MFYFLTSHKYSIYQTHCSESCRHEWYPHLIAVSLSGQVTLRKSRIHTKVWVTRRWIKISLQVPLFEMPNKLKFQDFLITSRGDSQSHEKWHSNTGPIPNCYKTMVTGKVSKHVYKQMTLHSCTWFYVPWNWKRDTFTNVLNVRLQLA
jgi:hypothetical protein